jgi:hypothetical protein
MSRLAFPFRFQWYASGGVIMTRTANALTKFGRTTNPTELEQLFGPPAVLTGAEAKRHRQIFRAFAQVVKPRDIIEWIYIWDLADYRTEIQRLQRLMPRLIQEARKARLQQRAMGIMRQTAQEKRWVSGGTDPELKAEIKNLKCKPEEVNAQVERLKAARIEEIQSEHRKAIQELTDEYEGDADDAASFGAWIGDYERADQCLVIAQKKYDQTLRQLDEYRGGLAERLRRADNTIIEGEFQEDTVQERQGSGPESACAVMLPIDDTTVATATGPNEPVAAAPAIAAGSTGRRPRRRPADAA